MTLPFVIDLIEFWSEHPPLHLMVEAFMTAKRDKSGGAQTLGKSVNEVVTPSGKVTLAEFAGYVSKYDSDSIRVKVNNHG